MIEALSSCQGLPRRKNIFFVKAAKVDAEQNIPTRLINGEEYYQLQCSIDELCQNKLETNGALRGEFDLKKFKLDFRNVNGGFEVRFGGTTFK